MTGKVKKRRPGAGLWWRLRGKKERRKTQSEERILVISDIHLGEDVLTEGPEHLGHYIRALNRELADFVASHCDRPRDRRRWHLVINGDMFDFVKVSVRPEFDDSGAEGLPEGARAAALEGDTGPLPNTPENVAWKLSRILEIHRPLFKQMARFLAEGHRVTIVEGNHDAEFFFEEVQQTLCEFLVKEAQKEHRRRGGKEDAFDPLSIADNIHFHSWFVASPGRFHIEHGHQYDEMCSFEYKLAPLDRPDADTVATPMSHRLMPYCAEMLGDFSTHGVDSWGFGKWLRYISTIQPAMIWEVSKVFFPMMMQLLFSSGAKRRTEQQEMADKQSEQLRWLADNSPYGLQALSALDRLRATPAEYFFTKILRLFYLDRFVITLLWLLSLGIATAIGDSTGWIIAAGSTLVCGVSVVLLVTARTSNLDETLRQAAAAIADETGARYVVFGHSHHPELVHLRQAYGVGRFGEEAYYFNGGSWVTREILRGEEGAGMTYVEIGSEGAALKRWVGQGQEPVVIASTEKTESEVSLSETTEAEVEEPSVAEESSQESVEEGQ